MELSVVGRRLESNETLAAGAVGGRAFDRPVFVCGHPRSGTTLLAALLDGHPELIVFPEELQFFPDVYRKRNRESAVLDKSGFRFICRRSREPRSESIDYSDIDADAVAADVKSLLTTLPTERALLVGLIAVWDRARRTRTGAETRWAEKTPKMERWASLAHHWFGNDAVFLHMLRDPRDNYPAYRKSHPRVTPLGFANRWALSTALGSDNQRRLLNYHLVRYEELVREPERTMDRVAGLIGVSPHPALYRPTCNGRPWSGNSSDNTAFAGVSTSQIGKYRQVLTAAEIAALERLLRGTMLRAGYRPETEDDGLGRMAAAAFGLWTGVRVMRQRLLTAWLARTD